MGRKAKPLPEGYQISKRWIPDPYDRGNEDPPPEREIRYYLQEKQPDGTWRDVAGPYRQSSYAWDWITRRKR